MKINEIINESMVKELAYPGNIGIMELTKFFQTATDEQKIHFKKLKAAGQMEEAWKYMQSVVGVKLHEDNLTMQKLQRYLPDNMKSAEFITEGLSHPIICIDVQPEYSGVSNGEENPLFTEIIQFVVKATGPVLMMVNAERDGLSGDSIDSIKQYWEETLSGEPEYDEETGEYNETESKIDWSRFTLYDKGYGYLRSWMDQGVPDAAIIKTVRMMYQSKVSDSRQLFGGQDSDTYEAGIKQLLGNDYLIGMGDPISVGWADIALLKRFSGAYIVGGCRNECLREVELLMSAFNIRYKRIDSLIYG